MSYLVTDLGSGLRVVKSFQKLKQAITTDTVLAHYDPQQKLELAVDAAHLVYGLGAVIMHVTPEGKHIYTNRICITEFKYT